FYPKFRRVNIYTMMREHGPCERHVIFFLGESRSGDVVLSNEHNAFEWLGFEEAIHRVKFPALKAIMYAAAKTLDPAFTLAPTPKKNDPPRASLKSEKR
ncbi:MAG: hypothetical protein AABY11_00650, partial [archaeon]